MYACACFPLSGGCYAASSQSTKSQSSYQSTNGPMSGFDSSFIGTPVPENLFPLPPCSPYYLEPQQLKTLAFSLGVYHRYYSVLQLLHFTTAASCTTCARAHIHTHMQTLVRTRAHACTRVCTLTCTHLHTRTLSLTHTHTRTHTHTKERSVTTTSSHNLTRASSYDHERRPPLSPRLSTHMHHTHTHTLTHTR